MRCTVAGDLYWPDGCRIESNGFSRIRSRGCLICCWPSRSDYGTGRSPVLWSSFVPAKGGDVFRRYSQPRGAGCSGLDLDCILTEVFRWPHLSIQCSERALAFQPSSPALTGHSPGFPKKIVGHSKCARDFPSHLKIRLLFCRVRTSSRYDRTSGVGVL